MPRHNPFHDPNVCGCPQCCEPTERTSMPEPDEFDPNPVNDTHRCSGAPEEITDEEWDARNAFANRRRGPLSIFLPAKKYEELRKSAQWVQSVPEYIDGLAESTLDQLDEYWEVTLRPHLKETIEVLGVETGPAGLIAVVSGPDNKEVRVRLRRKK